MSNFEVKVQPIFIKPHPNAELLEIGHIGSLDGWQVVVKRGLYSTDHLNPSYVAYIGENAVVPEWVLKKYGYWNEERGIGMLAGSKGDRVKAVKLRDQFSLGICIPVIHATVDGLNPTDKRRWGYFLEGQFDTLLCYENDDVSDFLGIAKYEAPVPTNMAGEVCSLVGYTLKFDIENVKKYPSVIQDGEAVVFSEKIHGCVHPDTKIMLPNGEEIEISEIISNPNYTHVLSFDVNTKQFKSKPITGRMRRPNTENKKWVLVTLESGRRLPITEDHPIYSKDRQCYIEAKDIFPGEEIESPF